MVDESDDFFSDFIDLESAEKQRDEEFFSDFVDLEQAEKQSQKEPSWLEVTGDVLTQAGLGALSYFTWPADVLKLGMIGEGLTDIDELEELHRKEGKPFDRKEYVKGVFDTARYIPTQELGEHAFEELSGISLQPKTEAGKAAKQFTRLAAFTPGGVAKRLTAGAIGAGSTQALKQAGVGEGKAELIGDVASLSPAAIQKVPSQITKAGTQFEKTAQKHALPFLEFMNRERAPLVKGKLFESTERRLKDAFDLSSTEAMKKIVRDELPLKRLNDRGVNLDALGEHAYEVTHQLAQKNPRPINTQPIVDNIDKEIARIQSLAPSPSDAQKTAIKILENERDILQVAKPSSEQLIMQHKNYNSDVKQIYRKPEFSGKEEQVRKTYAFLNNQLVEAIEKQGSSDVANSFKAANKIYSEKSKLYQTEAILNKAFKDGYSPKKLDKVLNSKQGNFLRRNMSKEGIKDLEEIARYGKEAQERMAQFIDIKSQTIFNEIKAWGQIAPLLLVPNKMAGGLLSIARPVAQHIQGKLLTRPATREVYKLTMKHAAEGAFNLLKKDFADLEKEISQEYGSVDEFMDAMLLDLPFYED